MTPAPHRPSALPLRGTPSGTAFGRWGAGLRLDTLKKNRHKRTQVTRSPLEI